MAMEKLLEMARKVADQAEIYSLENSSTSVSFKNGELQDINSSISAGVALRIIKDGRLGYAHTRNLKDPRELLDNALASLKGGVEAGFSFPHTAELPELKTWDPEIENLSSTRMVEECKRLSDALSTRADGEPGANAGSGMQTLRILNTAGTDVTTRWSSFGVSATLVFPGSATAVGRSHQAKMFEEMPANLLDETVELYNAATQLASPAGGPMKVLFMPRSMMALTWRIIAGTSAKSVYEKVSPLGEKVGQKIWDEKITLVDNPLEDSKPGARAFDDEGVAARKFTLAEKGVLQGFFSDLSYASKLGTEPTGHGYRSQVFGGDAITTKPSPSLSHLSILPGDKSFKDMVASMEKGLILEGALGAHSGNIPGGEYSVGVNPALYVENGEIVGQVKNAMVTGNMYKTLSNVAAVGDTLYPAAWGEMPAVLCDGVSVATKG